MRLDAIFRCSVLLLTGLASQAQAQTGGGMTGQFKIYKDCAESYARRFARTPERPQDISMAATSACYDKRLSLVSLVQAEPAKMSPQEALEYIGRVDRQIQMGVIQMILETRYPEAK